MVNFLGLLHNVIFGGDGIELIPGAVRHAMRTIFFSFISLIYRYISVLYILFKNLCNGRLLTGEILEKISSRIGLFLGLVMLFYILIGFVNMLIDPDKIADKKVGAVAIVKKVLIVIVMLGVSRFAFDLLYDIQSSIVSSNAISKLLLPYTVSVGDEEVKDDEGNNIDLFGNVLSEELLSAFYYMKDVSSADEESANLIESCKYSHEAFKNKIVYENDYELGNYCLNAYITMTGDGEDYETELMHFDWLFAIICGIFTLYLMLMYCIKIGIRMVQLACLEVIAPAPIISYLSPESKMFNTWIKIYFSTYIDVFIRIAIINFSTFLISAVFNSSGAENSFIFWKSVGTPTDDGTIAFYGVIMILAILGFAHKLPDLIKQLLPESVSKLGFGGMTMKDFAGLGTAVGVTTGAAVGAVGGFMGGKGLSRLSGFAGGFVGGAFRGGRSGTGASSIGDAVSKAQTNQAKANLSRAQRIASGQSFLDSVGTNVQNALGIIPGGAAADTRNMNALESYVKLQENIESYADNNSVVKRLFRDYENIQRGGRLRGESDAHFAQRVEDARSRYKNAQHAFIDAVSSGSDSFNYVNTDGTTGTETFDLGSDFNASNIRAGISERSRIQSEHRSLFNEYFRDAPGITYDNLDNNTNRARRDMATLSANRRRENK